MQFGIWPGREGDVSTLGGQFEKYVDIRYQKNMGLILAIYNITDTCF